MPRFRIPGTAILRSIAVPSLKRKALNSWSAAQDTYLSTKDIFERHRVVFTIGTSLASVATAWAGYTIRHLHETRVDQRLESIEQVIKSKHNVEEGELKKIVGSGSNNTAACFATAGTTLIIGYALGWRGGKWYANRKFKKEQMKLLGQLKPNRWQLLGRIKTKGWPIKLPGRPLTRPKVPEIAAETPVKMLKDAPTTNLKDS